MNPNLRAAAIIARSGQKAGCFTPGAEQFLVQETQLGLRFPSADVEWGESAAEAIARELDRGFDLSASVERLACVHESIRLVDGQPEHDVTLLHWCQVEGARDLPDTLPHEVRAGVKLVWRNIAQLREGLQMDKSICDLLANGDGPVLHLVDTRR